MVSLLLTYLLPCIPIMFFPWVQDFYDTGRWILLICFTLILIFFYLIHVIRTQTLTLTFRGPVRGLAAIAAASLISFLIASTNKVEALVHPIGLATWIAFICITTIAMSLIRKKEQNTMLWVFIVAVGLLGLTAIYQQFQIASIVFPHAAYLADVLWNPTGTPISAIFLFVIALPIAIHLTVGSFNAHEERNSIIGIIVSIITVLGLGITLWKFIPMWSTSIMPFSLGWTILLETWKTVQSALVGVGAENFLHAFTLGRPASMNTTALWNTTFSANASLALHIAVTNGILGLIGCIIFLVTFWKATPKILAYQITSVLCIIIILFFPPSFPILISMIVLCIAWDTTHATIMTLVPPAVALVTLFLLAVLGISGFGLIRYIQGEYLFNRSLTAAQQENNGTKAYDLDVRALQANIKISRYHIAFSQINLLLATSLLANASKSTASGAATLSTEDQQLATTLISQSIREAKTATTLSPDNVYAWTNLATIYQNLVGVASDSATWSTAVYQKAITLDPTNPVLRLNLGGIYMSMKDYDNAIQQFFTAITLKPNYTNAMYNLANAYAQKGDIKSAISAYTEVLNRIDKNSTDYTTVSEEMQQLQTKEPAGGQTLIVPTVTPTPTVVRQPLINP